MAVVLADGCFAAAHLAPLPGFASLFEAQPDAAVWAVDIPVGTVRRGWRASDAAARAVLGRRRSTIFATPPAGVLEATTYDDADRACRDATGAGLSRQSWGMVARMRDVDGARSRAPSGVSVVEAHPEISFQTLAGASLAAPKRTWAGHAERRALLAGAGIAVPDAIGAAGPAAAPDDVLDAAVVAWTAARVASGAAGTLPDPPEHDDDGRPLAVWY